MRRCCASGGLFKIRQGVPPAGKVLVEDDVCVDRAAFPATAQLPCCVIGDAAGLGDGLFCLGDLGSDPVGGRGRGLGRLGRGLEVLCRVCGLVFEGGEVEMVALQ